MTWCLNTFRVWGGLLMISALSAAELPESALGDLASDQFEVRRNAYAELKKWSVEHMKTSPESLYKAWRLSEDPEVKTRCFALMKEVLQQRKFGRGKGFVGVRMEWLIVPAKPGGKPRPGIKINLVLPDTPAEKSGLKVGDVLLGVDAIDFAKLPRAGVAFDAVSSFSVYIQSKFPDDVITLHLLRDGKMQDQEITLMKRPASADVDPFGRYLGVDKKKEAEQFFKKWLEEMDTNKP